MKYIGLFGLLLGLTIFGCSKATPLQPKSTAPALNQIQQTTSPDAARNHPGQPGYEPAYYNGQVYTINAIEVPNHAPEQAQADFYEVVYPIGWQNLGLQPPQCNPCDHDGNGIDALDYHDHVLDSVPSSPGHNAYRGLWHVWVIVPAYNGHSAHDKALNHVYAAHLPLKSEDAINRMLTLRLPDGSLVVNKKDAQFYFLCAVVNSNAAPTP